MFTFDNSTKNNISHSSQGKISADYIRPIKNLDGKYTVPRYLPSDYQGPPNNNTRKMPPLPTPHQHLNSPSAVQRSPSNAPSSATPSHNSAAIHREAAKGVQGTGRTLPHFDRIQHAFGHHDISHVRAYTGADAKVASRNISAEAYAMGNRIAFADSNPSLHTAAHEAAHIIQQQTGVQLKSGIGEVGDKYEQQADSVADLVVQGKPAETLLNFPVSDNVSHPTSQAPVQMVPGYIPKSRLGNYQLNDRSSTAGGKFGAKRTTIRNENRRRAGFPPGTTLGLRSDMDGTQLAEPADVDKIRAEVDHIVPVNQGGSNTYRNAQVLSARQNGAAGKGGQYPWTDQPNYNGADLWVSQATAGVPANTPIETKNISGTWYFRVPMGVGPIPALLLPHIRMNNSPGFPLYYNSILGGPVPISDTHTPIPDLWIPHIAAINIGLAPPQPPS